MLVNKTVTPEGVLAEKWLARTGAAEEPLGAGQNMTSPEPWETDSLTLIGLHRDPTLVRLAQPTERPPGMRVLESYDWEMGLPQHLLIHPMSVSGIEPGGTVWAGIVSTATTSRGTFSEEFTKVLANLTGMSGCSTAEFPNQTARQVGSLSLVESIAAERRLADFDSDSMEVAKLATNDAAVLLQHNDIRGTPRIMFADDGILTLQWQKGEYGVALLFAGDGEVSIAFRRPGQFYSENGIDIPVAEQLPDEFMEALAKTLS